MKYAVIESMTTVDLGHTLIRVWREQKEVCDDYDNADISRICEEFQYRTAGVTQKEIAETIVGMERVNAVEVKDSHGNGVVLYKEWP